MSKFTTVPVNPIGNFITRSQNFSMSNYQLINFFVETKKANAQISFKVEASKEGTPAKAIGFQFAENGDSNVKNISEEGISITHQGDESKVWQVIIGDRNLAHDECDSVALVVTESEADSVTSIFALQTQPRYEGNE